MLSLLLIVVAATVMVGADLTQSEAQVFGPPPCGRFTAGQRFVLFDKGTSVCDNTSGLFWERAPSPAQRNLQDARAYCAVKGPGWQLPGIKDFFALADYANANPALPSGHPFVVVNSEYFSDTPRVGHPDEVWSFVLDEGKTFANGPGGTAYVWCVR